MAVTNQNSSQVTNRLADPQVIEPPGDIGARLRVSYFNFTQSGAGDATSQAVLARLPAGRVRVYGIVGKHSAFGAARTGDFGYAQHTDNDGENVAADPDHFSADTDVSAAGTIRVDPMKAITSKGGFDLTFQCNDGTLPDAATLEGYVLYAHD